MGLGIGQPLLKTLCKARSLLAWQRDLYLLRPTALCVRRFFFNNFFRFIQCFWLLVSERVLVSHSLSLFLFYLFSDTALYEGVSVCRMVRLSDGPSVGWSVRQMVKSIGNLLFWRPKMDNFLYENHWGSPALTLLNVLNVVNVVNVLNVLNVLYVLNVPKDAS